MSSSKQSFQGWIAQLPPVQSETKPDGSTLSASPLQFSLVIPTYNERHNLEILIEQLRQLLDRLLSHDYELIVVDDDSPDRTWEVAQRLAETYPQVHALRRQGERGLSTAVIRGWQMSQGHVLGVIDADLQHPPEILEQLWQQIERGADLALASRHVDGGGVSDWSLSRRILSRGAQLVGLILLPGVVGRVSDPMSGFFMVRRSAIAERFLDPVGYKILIEVLGRGDISWIGEVGYVFQEREQGQSKVTWKQYLDYLQHLGKLRLDLLPVQRFLRFGLVGLTGVVVDLAIFYLLRERWQLGLTRSAMLSAEVAILNNFYWNDRWTFSDLSRQQRGWRKQLKRFLKFNIVCLAGLILNVLIVNLLFNLLGVNDYLAKLLAIALVTLWNFSINLKLSWRVTDVSDP
ncbi:sulfonate ABC transporter permease [Phormidium willei BDU 130791]|nr:sulfonate ABC transporter permease [Phormidium willei BDU 130791]